jgi:hypothetical protein
MRGRRLGPACGGSEIGREDDDVSGSEAPIGVGGLEGAEVAFFALAGEVHAACGGARLAAAGKADGFGDGDAVEEGEGLGAGGEVTLDGDDSDVFDRLDVDEDRGGGHAGDAEDGADGLGGLGQGKAAETGGADFADPGIALKVDDGEAFPEGFGGAEALMDLKPEGVSGAEGAAGVEGNVGVVAVHFIAAAGEHATNLGEVREAGQGDGRGVFFDGIASGEADGEGGGKEEAGGVHAEERRGEGKRAFIDARKGRHMMGPARRLARRVWAWAGAEAEIGDSGGGGFGDGAHEPGVVSEQTVEPENGAEEEEKEDEPAKPGDEGLGGASASALHGLGMGGRGESQPAPGRACK